LELGRAVSRLNKRLEKEPFILMGPGRWGSANIDLGVRVTYADIYNTEVLIEIGVAQDGHMPELSYGTHFYQDLVESGIHSLPLRLGTGEDFMDWEFFRESPNMLAHLSPQDEALSDYLRVIDVAAVTNNRRLNILMDGANDDAVGFLAKGDWKTAQDPLATVSHF
jgi:pyruvate, water dikinase